MKIEKLRAHGRRLGREGISKKIIDLVEDFDGSYKGAVELAGRLSVLAKCASFDTYWSEKVGLGEYKQTCALESEAERQEGENGTERNSPRG